MKVESTMATHADYDESTETMHVRFKSGETVGYRGVPKTVFEALVKAESFGKYMRDHIIGRYGHG